MKERTRKIANNGNTDRYFVNLKLNSNPQFHTDHTQTHNINKLTLKTRDVHELRIHSADDKGLRRH